MFSLEIYLKKKLYNYKIMVLCNVIIDFETPCHESDIICKYII